MWPVHGRAYSLCELRVMAPPNSQDTPQLDMKFGILRQTGGQPILLD